MLFDPNDDWFNDPILQALARRQRGQRGHVGIEAPEDRPPPQQPRDPGEWIPDEPPPAPREPEDWVPTDEVPAPERPSDPTVPPPGDIPIERPELPVVPPPPGVPQGPVGGPPVSERLAFGPVSAALANAGGEFTPLRTMASRSGISRGRRRGFPRQRTIKYY